MKTWSLSLLTLLCATFTYGQGTVRGKVTDPNGETLIGASVALKGSPTGTAADLDGNYSLPIKEAGPKTIVFSFITFQDQEITVEPKNGEVLIVNVELKPAANELKEVVVEGKARRAGDTYLEKLKINSATNIDYISSDQMVRTGDSDAAQAVKRVTGVSTVGAFVTVRGLADRYLVTTINGSRIPTLDPLTNNLRLDLFPTGLMDNIVITKTASPELPGDWSGAFISLNTSDYPSRLRVSVSTTLGYNPNSSFKDIVTAKRSSTDWLGYDDGLRAIPGGVPLDNEDFPRFIEPDLYQQLVQLGLGPFLQQYGIVASTPGFNSTNMGTSNSLQHLALTELGLLAPGLINDPNAVEAAVEGYNSTYDLGYFSPILNADIAELNGKFNNDNWRVVTEQGRPNYNLSFNIGNQIPLFKKKDSPSTLGYLFGLRYSTETEYDGASTLTRTGEPFEDTNPGDQYGRSGTQKISTESAGWNAIGNLSWKIDRNNSISLMVMPNILGQNNARYLEFLNPGLSTDTLVSEDQFYEQRKLMVYQFGSRHLIPALNLKVDLDVSYSDGDRDVLDLKTVQYILPPPGQPITDVDGALGQPSRIYRFMDESILDTRLGFELPLGSDERKNHKLKFGGGYLNNTRRNIQTYFNILGAPGPTQWTDAERFEMNEDGRFVSRYTTFGTFKDNDIGINQIMFGYLLGDVAVLPKLRLVVGARVEHTDMLTDILRYYEDGVAADDPVRGTVGDQTIPGGSNPEQKPAKPGILDQWDLLPSVNLIYKLKDDREVPMNLRLSYFRSLARPSFREFSVVQLFDYILSAPVYGNPDLRVTSIDNFDVRVEKFFRSGNNISLSGFHKRFRDHIELLYTTAGGYTWRNADFSTVTGVELEGRIGIFRWLEWRGNLTWMESESELTSVFTAEPTKYTTPMYGQAPYIVNSMLTYHADSLGLELSVSYNVQGPKLAISNSEVNPKGIRAYEMPRHLIDVTLGKTFGDHWGVRFKARNLLNSALRRSYLFESGYDVDFDKYRYGTEYSLSISYTIR
ncbi:MAG: carboxypeptidase-like regulatory domain-containing protein [Flavobacteriales bacterium]|nr:carboxypeptidase-like regulatory domain-containing protein [Flavobacteriales bacterium]